ncbi:MAG: hypothetical protein MUC90_08510 [Thermoplasmata archaeon]|nr:hypothetical protein [Thermoplasmata archaeon]
MELPILLLASASVPFGLVAMHDILSGEKKRGVFGIASAAWSFSGIFLVYLGVPGLLFFPGLMVILLASSLSRARRGGGVAQYLRPLALAALLVLITAGLVLL